MSLPWSRKILKVVGAGFSVVLILAFANCSKATSVKLGNSPEPSVGQVPGELTFQRLPSSLNLPLGCRLRKS